MLLFVIVVSNSKLVLNRGKTRFLLLFPLNYNGPPGSSLSVVCLFFLNAIGGIETLRQLGSLGKANFKAAKSLTAWEYLQQVKATAKDSQVL